MSKCEHLEFHVEAVVNRFEDTGTFNLEIQVRCMECEVLFEFLGLETGLSAYGPRTSFGSDELRIPIMPPGMTIPDGLTGFEIRGPAIDMEAN